MPKSRIASGVCHVREELSTVGSNCEAPASVPRVALAGAASGTTGLVTTRAPGRAVCAGRFFGVAFGFVTFAFVTRFGLEGTGRETGAGGGEAGGALLVDAGGGVLAGGAVDG